MLKRLLFVITAIPVMIISWLAMTLLIVGVLLSVVVVEPFSWIITGKHSIDYINKITSGPKCEDFGNLIMDEGLFTRYREWCTKNGQNKI